MKKFMILFTAAALMQTAVFAQTWTSDKAHSNLKFTITHLMLSDVEGRINDFDATITSAKPDFSDAKVDFTAKVGTIDTDNEKRDAHLKSEDFFDVAKYPTMTFTSTGITKVAANKYKLTGNLTMHGVTKPVTLDLWFRGTRVHPMTKADIAGFQLTGTVKRSDFNVGVPKFPEAMLSDEVTIKANGEFAKAK